MTLAAIARANQIGRVPPSVSPRAPYAVEPNGFPLPALAAAAGRAPLGGPREVALACLLVSRLAVDAASPRVLSSDQRRARAVAAKQWLAAATIPVGIRAALTRLADATGGDDRNAIKAALASVMTVTANHLDSAARLELGRLAQIVAE